MINNKEEIINALKEQNILNSEWKNTLVIGDVHFGIKSNSIPWLDSQLKFFHEQIFPIIENTELYNISDIVFLGDLFDIRYSTNNYISIEVKKLFREMIDLIRYKKVSIVCIAGNHDYYSPIEELKEYNVYDSVFGQEFMNAYEGRFNYVTDKGIAILKYDENNICIGNAILLPWYETENREKFKKHINDISFFNKTNKENPVRAIYCHTDLEPEFADDPEIASALKELDIPIYSGHIHYMYTNKEKKFYNLGACCAFTFNDANQSRYVYIINEKENKCVRIENVTTPKFIILRDEEIFDENPKYYNNNYVEFIISECNKNQLRYKEQITKLKLQYPSSNIRVKIVTDSTLFCTNNGININTNIEQYIENNIPDNLKDNLNIIKEELSQNNK